MPDSFLTSWATLGAMGVLKIEPPEGQCYMVSPGSLHATGRVSLGHDEFQNSGEFGGSLKDSIGAKGILIPIGSGEPILAAGEVPFHGSWEGPFTSRALHLRNQTASSINVAVSGDVVTFADELIDDSFTVYARTNGADVAALVPQEGKAYLITYAGCSHYASWDLVNESGTIIMILEEGVQRWWLWGGNGLRIRLRSLTSSNHEGSIRVVRYDVGDLPEYTDRIDIKQLMGSNAIYDIRPPEGERWYVDMHNLGSGISARYKDGVVSISVPRSMVLTHDNWIRAVNDPTPRTLFVTGTKEKL